jgi:hypothetical protein
VAEGLGEPSPGLLLTAAAASDVTDLLPVTACSLQGQVLSRIQDQDSQQLSHT